MPDYAILKQTLADAGPAADREMAYFYSLLFTAHPELRAMFPLAMDEQRRALSAALARCVWSMDNPQSMHEYLAQLGRDHRKYGVQEQHTRSSVRRWPARCGSSTGRRGATRPRPPGTRPSATSAR
jgi:hemoglobin-like flavoprotein